MLGLVRRLCKSIVYLSICLASFSQTSLAIEEVKVAQFGKEKFLLYLPLYLAMERGYFAQNNINIELLFSGNDDQVFATVASGAADFGVGDPVFTAIAREKGFKSKTIAMMITKLGITGFTNLDKIRLISSTDELAGLRISSLPKPSTTYTLLDEIRRKNPRLNSNLKIVEASMGAHVALLESGQVDIATELEPTVSLLETKGYRVVLNLNQYIAPQVITGLMATEDRIDNSPEVVQGMVAALEKALWTIENQPAEAVMSAKHIFKDLPPEVVERAVARMRANQVYPRSTLIPDDLWQRTLKTRLDSGQLKSPQATEVAVENRFAVEASRRILSAVTGEGPGK